MTTTRVTLPYGDDERTLTVASANLAWVVSPASQPGVQDVETAVREAISHPTGGPALGELARGVDGDVVILVDDNTRCTPHPQLLPILLDELNGHGIPDRRIKLLIALGTHRPMSLAERETHFGAEVLSRVPVHNLPGDDFVDLGWTPSGVPIHVSRMYHEAALSIAVGSVIPHPVAGFSGGAKMVQPGVCSSVTTARTHMMGAAQAREILGNAENPVRAEMEEIARRSGLAFIVNTVLNRHGEVVSVVAGDLVRAHRCGVEMAKSLYGVAIPEVVDIAVVSATPADRDLWQGIKAVTAAGLTVRPGGEIILVTPAPEGVCVEHPCLVELGDRHWRAVEDAALCGQVDDEVGASTHIVLGLTRAFARITVVSDGIKIADAECMGLQHAPSLQDALDAAVSQVGPDARIGVITEGGEVLPIVGDSPA